MKKNILNSVIAVVMLVAVGCAAKKKVVPATATTPKTVSSKEETINAIAARNFDFTTLALKAKTDLVINNAQSDVTLNIRMKKDQAIWVHVSALAGIEVARAYITPDSIKILNRLENVYLNKPFSFVHQYTNDGVNFEMLQSIFVGNAVQQLLKNGGEFSTGTPLRLNGLLSSLSYNLIFSPTNKLVQTNLKDTKEGQALSINYADFISTDGKEFPQSVSIRSQAGNKNVAAELKYTKIDVNTSVEMPFNVPRRFTVLN